LVFSFIFSPIFGGVLLMQNLLEAKLKKEAYLILVLSILYTLLEIFLLNIQERPQSSLSYVFNGFGGLVLSEFFFKKYFKNETQYQKKKIWKPLIISILITIPFLVVLIL